MRKLLVAALTVVAAVGCGDKGEVSESDAAKNKEAFSQEAYEDAMKKAGKGAELEAEKKRNAAYLQGQSGQQ